VPIGVSVVVQFVYVVVVVLLWLLLDVVLPSW
jgi:hypothetical protein